MGNERQRSYGGRTSAERAAERRRSFLAAGRQVWGEHGLAAVTVRRVCSTAGLADRYLYEEFGDVQGLIEAVAQDVGAQLHHAMLSAGVGGGPPADALRRGLEGFLQAVVEDPSIMTIMTEGPSAPWLASVRAEAQRQVATAIVLAVDPTNGAVDFGSREFRSAYFCVGGVSLLIERWLSDSAIQTPAELAAEALTFCSAVLELAA